MKIRHADNHFENKNTNRLNSMSIDVLKNPQLGRIYYNMNYKRKQYIEESIHTPRFIRTPLGILMPIQRSKPNGNTIPRSIKIINKKAIEKNPHIITDRTGVFPELARNDFISTIRTPNSTMNNTNTHLKIRILKPRVMQNESSSSIQRENICYTSQRQLPVAIMYNSYELCKIIRYRADDITLIEKNCMESSLLMDNLKIFIFDIERKEIKRSFIESQKLENLKGLYSDDFDIKRNIIRTLKKTISEFERKYFGKLINAEEDTIKNQVDFIMSGEVIHKPPISYDKTLDITLKSAFREPKLDSSFIFSICCLYTKILLRKKLEKLIKIFHNNLKLSQKTKFWRKTLIKGENVEGMQSRYNKMCKGRIYDVLYNRNKYVSKGIKIYADEYS